MTPRRALRVGELFDATWLATLLGARKYTSYTTLWNVVGNPAASVPAGLGPDGLPIGVQLIGRPHAEETVLGLAAQLERTGPPVVGPPSRVRMRKRCTRRPAACDGFPCSHDRLPVLRTVD